MNIEQTDKYQIVTSDVDCLLRDTSDNSLCTTAYLPLSLTEEEIRNRFVEINKTGFIIRQGNFVYTKLQIRMAMRTLGIQNKLIGLLNTNETYKTDWNDAKEIDLYSEEVQEALGQSSITQKDIDDIIQEIKAQGDKYLGEKLIKQLYTINVDDQIQVDLDVLRDKIENI